MPTTEQVIQAQFLRRDTTFSTSALAIVLDNWGTEALSWEPSVLNKELETGLNVEPNDLLADKLQAAASLLTTNLFHVSLEAFNSMVQVFSFQEADFQDFIPASLDEIAWGVVEARMMEGPEEAKEQGFSHDIQGFVGQMMSNEGLTRKPRALEWAALPEGEEDNRDEILSQDPAFFSAYWGRQEEVLQDIEKLVASHARALVGQLAEIPFESADNQFAKKILEQT